MHIYGLWETVFVKGHRKHKYYINNNIFEKKNWHPHLNIRSNQQNILLKRALYFRSQNVELLPYNSIKNNNKYH